MVFHHTFGTIHLKQLVMVWWSVAKLWREYGISPSSWHHSSKTAYDTISWNTAQMCLKLRSQIGSKPICPFIHKVGSPQPCSALLFAKPLTDHCRAEIFVLCRQAWTLQSLFKEAKGPKGPFWQTWRNPPAHFQYLPPTFETTIREQCKSHLTSLTHAHYYDNRTIGLSAVPLSSTKWHQVQP